MRFTPWNPIRKAGWIKLIYPKTIAVGDEAQFIARCQAVTSVSFTGEKHCFHIPAERTVWFFDIFRDQEKWTAEITLNLYFTNPVSNMFDDLSDEEKAFRWSTYDFDMRTFPDLESQGWSDAAVDTFVATVKPNPELYAKGIDTLFGTQFRPVLKCNTPCYTCLGSDRDYCTDCWGPGAPGGGGEYKNIFLVQAAGGATCKEQCDSHQTVNGNVKEMVNSQGVRDPTWDYNVCQECDVTCGNCKG